MAVAIAVLAGVVLVTAGAFFAPRLHVPLQLLLVVIGVLVSLVPGVPRIELNADLVLGGLLPPLLYAAAVRASLVDLKRTLPTVLVLAVVPVVATVFAVGFVLHAVLPAVGLAAALALGAAVGPPDAVSATSLGRSVGMPRRLTALLEDESLLNDPVALTAQGVAIMAITETITPLVVGRDLLVSVVGGAAGGVLVGVVARAVRKRLQDPVLATVVSFAIPYAAFLPAEAVNGSGVLAVVLAGLIVAQATPRTTSPRARVAEAVNWRTVSFVLENGVFLLIGLQLPALLEGVSGSGLGVGGVVLACALALVVVILTRFAVVFAAWGIAGRVLRQRVDARGVALLGWAGMRGVVTLAAAFLLPDIPARPVLQLAAFTVVGGTLLLQGLTLGPLTRRLRLSADDDAADALQAAELMDRAVGAASRRLDDLLTGDEPADVVRALRSRNEAQSSSLWEMLGDRTRGETPTQTYRRLRTEMLTAQREAVLAARGTGQTDDEVLRTALLSIDQEEATLDRREDVDSSGGDDLVDPHHGAGSCVHLREAPEAIRPRTPGECEDCIREGTTWVHLRTCLTCGHVGCCDSSERRHATRHFHETRHPVMRSAEPGEAWRWCYVDERLG